MSKEYGYARISTPKQNIDRQVRNILAEHPHAHMIKEVFTGTKFQGRKELDKLLRTVKSGDTIIFDSVSRMSRNAEEGFLPMRNMLVANHLIPSKCSSEKAGSFLTSLLFKQLIFLSPFLTFEYKKQTSM